MYLRRKISVDLKIYLEVISEGKKIQAFTCNSNKFDLSIPNAAIFVCHQVVTYFDAKRTLGTRSYQIWHKARACNAHQSLPLMIIAEAKKKTKQQSMSSST